LSWARASDATSYAYCIDTSNNNTCNASWVSTGSGTSVGLSSLAAGTTYYCMVRASNANGTPIQHRHVVAFHHTTTAPGPVVVDEIILDDDNYPNSIGNNNHSADCGEIIELLAYLRNNGSLTANGVAAPSAPATRMSSIGLTTPPAGMAISPAAPCW